MNTEAEEPRSDSHDLCDESELSEDQQAEFFAREFELLIDRLDDRAADLLDSFVASRTLLPAERDRLQRFARLCLRFAHLERRIEGKINCEIPAHLSILSDDGGESLSEESENLASAERSRLEIPDGPVEDLARLLDDRGIKVVEWDQPTAQYAGAFLFDSETGPALLSLAPAGSAAGRFILAHEYCHLLADVDPYENRFCVHGSGRSCVEARCGGRLPGESLPGDEHEFFGRAESRADYFARALLLPKEHFSRTLGDFGEGGRHGFHVGRLSELAFYYEVETPVVLNRLADLGLLPCAEAADMAAGADSPQPPVAGPAGRKRASVEETLPVRFVHLSLALFVSRIASRDHLSRLLDIKPRAVNRLVSWLDLPSDFRERQSSDRLG